MGLDGSLEPQWLSSYVEFVLELRANFGPYDPVRDTESELKCLHMKDNQRITKYLVDFSHLAAICQWGEPALCHQFYHGLPACIKDEITCVGKLCLLADLQKLSQSIDTHYWEHHSEISQETSASKNAASSKPVLDQKNMKPNNNNSSSSS